MKKIFNNYGLTIIMSIFLLGGCAGNDKDNNDSISGEKKKPKVYSSQQEKIQENLKQGQGLLNRKRKYDFPTSNPIWQGTLTALKDMPLGTVDFFGGVISTDWYQPNKSVKNEYIKISVYFNSSEVKVSSFDVVGFKKVCDKTNCSTAKTSEGFNKKIKTAIISNSRKLLTK